MKALLSLKKICKVIWIDETSLEDVDKKILIKNFQIILGARFEAVNDIDQALQVTKDYEKYCHIFICSLSMYECFKARIIGKQLYIHQKCLILCANVAQRNLVLENKLYKQTAYDPILQINQIQPIILKIETECLSPQLPSISQITINQLKPINPQIKIICIIKENQTIIISGIQDMRYLTEDEANQEMQQQNQIMSEERKQYVIIFTDLSIKYKAWLQTIQILSLIIYYQQQNIEPGQIDFPNFKKINNSDQLRNELEKTNLFKRVEDV